MEKEIHKTIKYFSFFKYAPTLEEIYTFLGKKTSKKALQEELERLSDRKKISHPPAGGSISDIQYQINHHYNLIRYTLPQYDNRIKNLELRIKNSQSKIENLRFRFYIKLISIFPQIRLVGLSGSISMMNAKENDDIDLFIITAKNRLFTGRLIALMLAQILGLRRERNITRSYKVLSSRLQAKNLKLPCYFATLLPCYKLKVISYRNKVCLNLFFDESDLEVPKFKKTSYVAHEILQMKPIVNKNNTYEKFLEANEWIYKFFPNANISTVIPASSSVIPAKAGIYLKNPWIPACAGMTGLIEKKFKKFQLRLINKHRTNELITDTQLWFHPDDFGEKIKGV